jgi:hypothetical protein
VLLVLVLGEGPAYFRPLLRARRRHPATPPRRLPSPLPPLV